MSDWHLWPAEQALWEGRRERGVPYERWWAWAATGAFFVAVITVLFSGLLWVVELPGARMTAALAGVFAMIGVGLVLAPAYRRDPCRYLITDRRVIFRRGSVLRSLERRTITYVRIHWHYRLNRVGTLELVRATPFGPLLRRQRLRLFDIAEPDRVLAYLRGTVGTEHLGDCSLPVVERLDDGEKVVWGGHPAGWLIGWREVLTSLAGSGVIAVALLYGYRTMTILVDLENRGLFPRSWEWVLLFLAIAMTFVFLMSVGGVVVWHGLWRARSMGLATEYLLTDRRLMVRRGRTELSVERDRIVDVVARKASRKLHHLFLVLDTPGSRALSDSGALGQLIPSREALLPVLYEVTDAKKLRQLILGDRASQPG